MATTERVEREVVVELGVPGPISEGVAGSEGGGGTVVVDTLEFGSRRISGSQLLAHG